MNSKNSSIVISVINIKFKNKNSVESSSAGADRESTAFSLNLDAPSNTTSTSVRMDSVKTASFDIVSISLLIVSCPSSIPAIVSSSMFDIFSFLDIPVSINPSIISITKDVRIPSADPSIASKAIYLFFLFFILYLCCAFLL